MEIASCWVIHTKRRDNVFKPFVTPAEMVLLVNEFQDIAQRFPIHNLEVFGALTRKDLEGKEDAEKDFLRLKEQQRRQFQTWDSKQERNRLRQKYGRNENEKKYKIDILYPGESTELPDTFEKLGKVMLEQAQTNGLDKVVPMPDDNELPPLEAELTDAELPAN